MPKKITVKFIGSAADKQNMRLSDFIDQLEGIKRALRENERSITGEDEVSLDYRIVGLRHHSPSEMDLEPVALREVPKAFGNEVVAAFASELLSIRKQGRTVHAPELTRLQAYQDLGRQKAGKLDSVQISVGRTRVQIDDVFQGKLEKIMGPDELMNGSISGFLEAVNFHNTNRFTLYPTLGPKKVAGRFSSDRRAQVKAAIGSFVTVSGQLAYKSWAPFAHAIYIQDSYGDIVVHKPDEELPTLFEIKGTVPDLTGKESSVEFIERIRNENW